MDDRRDSAPDTVHGNDSQGTLASGNRGRRLNVCFRRRRLDEDDVRHRLWGGDGGVGCQLPHLAVWRLILSLITGILLFAGLYLLALWASKTDDQILRILINSTKYRHQYDPLKWQFFPVEWRRQ